MTQFYKHILTLWTVYEIRKIFRLQTGPVEFQIRLPEQTFTCPSLWVATKFHCKMIKSYLKIEISNCPAGPVLGAVRLPEQVSDHHCGRASAYFVHCYGTFN